MKRAPAPRAGERGERGTRAERAERGAVARPRVREPWAWLAAAAVLPVVLHAFGAPLGEPFADDFDYLRRTLLGGPPSWLDGGGAVLYWRPLARQAYFAALARLVVTHPGAVAALHALLLALTAWCLYRAFRVSCGGPVAAAIASFPLLMDATRMLLGWPSAFSDLGALLFAALALHEAARDRIATALAALLAALLCKEVAIGAALLLPWFPGTRAGGPVTRHRRLVWLGAVVAALAAWGAAYALACRAGGMTLPATFTAAPGGVPLAARLGWAFANSLRAAFSLAPAGGRYAREIAIGAAALVAAAVLRALASAPRRARLVAHLPAIGWGALWWAAGAAAIAGVYPLWSPYRAVFASLGLGVALVLAVAPAGGAAVAALVALRLVAFALSPAPPAAITVTANENGAVLDFPRMVRLERLVVDARGALLHRFPALPRGAAIGAHAIPQLAEYAFAGDHALQVWYADTTLRFVPYRDFGEHPELPVAAFVEFQPNQHPQVALVATEAMRLYLAGSVFAERGQLDAALAALARADSVQSHWPPAPTFSGSVAGLRALALLKFGHAAEAEREARRGLALLPQNFGAEFLLAVLAFQHGELDTADRYVNAVLAFRPNDQDARALREQIQRARRGP